MTAARSLALLSFVSALMITIDAWGQTTDGFSSSRFNPSERGSDWFINESLDLRGHQRLALGVVFDYSKNALVAYDAEGSIAARLVSQQLYGHVGGAYLLFSRVRLAANVPLLLINTGESVATPDGAYANDLGFALGDVRIGADVLVTGQYDKPFSLAVGTQFFVPTGSQNAFASDGTVRVLPRAMVAGNLGIWTYATQVGIHVRPHDAAFAGSRVGHELSMSAATGVRLADRKLLIGPEVSTSTVLAEPFGEQSTPLEVLLSGRYVLANDFRVGAGAGPGLTKGLGSPKYRVVAGFEWFPAIVEHQSPDTDGDGIVDEHDQCPTVSAGAVPDPARQGCPAVDSDGDGFLDHLDACPRRAGPDNTDPKKRGCPPPPQPSDTDQDGIPDSEDACPEEKGVPSAEPESHGCPPARLEKPIQQIRILHRIEFEYDSDRLRGQSELVLQAVKEIIDKHPEITLIEIQGHTDNRGTTGYNQNLSERRAETVRFWLVQHGIEGSRLRAVGYGQDRPRASNETAAGRRANRRVEFHIIEENGKPVERPDTEISPDDAQKDATPLGDEGSEDAAAPDAQ